MPFAVPVFLSMASVLRPPPMAETITLVRKRRNKRKKRENTFRAKVLLFRPSSLLLSKQRTDALLAQRRDQSIMITRTDSECPPPLLCAVLLYLILLIVFPYIILDCIGKCVPFLFFPWMRWSVGVFSSYFRKRKKAVRTLSDLS